MAAPQVTAKIENGWGIVLRTSPGFGQWEFSIPVLLHYLSAGVMDMITRRTDEERDVNNQRFQRYGRQTWLVRTNEPGKDGRGKVYRNSLGQWSEYVVRDGKTPVTLRSLVDVPERHRMRGGLLVRPDVLKSLKLDHRGAVVGNVRKCTVTVGGGHKNLAGKHVSNMARALLVSGAKGEIDLDSDAMGGVPKREWVGVHPVEWRMLLDGITHDGILGFIRNRRRDIVHENLARSQMALQRTASARARAAKRAQKSAEAQNRLDVQRVARLGKQDGETAREAWKRQSTKRRQRKGERREKRSNPSLRTAP